MKPIIAQYVLLHWVEYFRLKNFLVRIFIQLESNRAETRVFRILDFIVILLSLRSKKKRNNCAKYSPHNFFTRDYRRRPHCELNRE